MNAMRSPLDIQQLAADVLASVDADEALRAKTASEVTPTGTLKTDVGRALKLAAEKIRALDDTTVTAADLDTVLTGARTKMASALGAMAGGAMGAGMGPLGMAGGAALGHAMTGGAATGPAQASTNLGNVSAAAATPKLASGLGNELRKIAADIRKQGEGSEDLRAVKAAQMLNAAVGLQHLVHSVRNR